MPPKTAKKSNSKDGKAALAKKKEGSGEEKKKWPKSKRDKLKVVLFDQATKLYKEIVSMKLITPWSPNASWSVHR